MDQDIAAILARLPAEDAVALRAYIERLHATIARQAADVGDIESAWAESARRHGAEIDRLARINRRQRQRLQRQPVTSS